MPYIQTTADRVRELREKSHQFNSIVSKKCLDVGGWGVGGQGVQQDEGRRRRRRVIA